MTHRVEQMEPLRKEHVFAFFVVFALYISVRLYVLHHTVLLEDHDSIGLLSWIPPFLEFDVRRIVGLDPDASIFTAFFAALFSLPGWTHETGARAASLFSSMVLFVALIGIGLRVARPTAVIVGLFLLSLNPELAPLSVAVLTEPTYVALVYLGLMLFVFQTGFPTLLGASLAGLVFGLAFLTRLEGVLFLGFIPLMLFLFFFLQRPPGLSFSRIAAWAAVFLAVFGALVGLQVWRVSNEMGFLAINGRQAWTILMNSPAFGSSYLEKIYGLDFHPGTINISYLKANFAMASSLAVEQVSIFEWVKTYALLVIANLNNFYSRGLTTLFGHLVVVFFVFGLAYLYRSRRMFSLYFVVGVIAVGLAAPLLHNVVIRHIMVIAPIVLLVAGIGIDAVARAILKEHSWGNSRWVQSIAIYGLAFAVAAAWAFPLRSAMKPPEVNNHYSLIELEQPIAIIKKVMEESPGERPTLMNRMYFLSHYSGANGMSMPYTDFDGLVKYSTLNGVDFVYLDRRAERFPWYVTFASGSAGPHFSLRYEGVDGLGNPVSLYAFEPHNSGTVGDGAAEE